jgi:hypothetical protein
VWRMWAITHGALALPPAKVGVSQALVLCFEQRRPLDQDTLTLVALAGARPLHDDCLQCGMGDRLSASGRLPVVAAETYKEQR